MEGGCGDCVAGDYGICESWVGTDADTAGVLYAQNISAGDNEFILFGKFSERNLARIMDDWDYKVRDLKVLDKKIKALKLSGDR